MKHNLYDMIQQKQGSSHDCTDNTTSTTRHHKGAKPAQGLRKILAILMLMTISISTWAQTYVFISNETNGYFIGLVNGNAVATQTFITGSCVWTASGTLDAWNLRTLRIGTSYLDGSNNNSGTVSIGSNRNGYWGGNNNQLSYYRSAWRTVYRDGTQVKWNGNNNVFRVYTSYSTTAEEFTVANISGINDLVTETGTYNLSSDASYTPEYYTFTGPDTRYYAAGYTTGAVTARPNAKTSGFSSDTWSLDVSIPGLSISNTGVLTYNTYVTENTRVTITHSVTENGQTKTATRTITLKGTIVTSLSFVSTSLDMTATSLSLPAVNLTASNGSTPTGTMTYSSNNTDCINVSNTGVLTINGAGTATITANYAANGNYLGSSTTMVITVANTDALNETNLGEMTITPSGQTLDLGQQVTYTASETISSINRTRPAYSTITAGGNTYYKVGANYQATIPAITEDDTPIRFTSFNWSAPEGGAYFTLAPYYSASSNEVTLTRTEQKTGTQQTFTISVTGVYAGQNKTASATVTIPKTQVNPTAIHPEPTNITLALGASANISYTAEPNYDAAGETYLNITYSSSSTSVATVSADGTIKAIGEGDAIITLRAINLDGSNGVTATVSVTVQQGNGNSANDPYFIYDASGLTYMANNPGKYYQISADFSVSSNTSINNFSGTLDGDYHTISGLTQPLFNTVSNATIKNVVLEAVTISSTATNVGPLVCTAGGNTVIYNCGVRNTYASDPANNVYASQENISAQSSVSGGTNVGGLVGRLNDNSKVVNCYSYANVTGGTNCGGIVGYADNTVQITNTTQVRFQHNESGYWMTDHNSELKLRPNGNNGYPNWQIWFLESSSNGYKLRNRGRADNHPESQYLVQSGADGWNAAFNGTGDVYTLVQNSDGTFYIRGNNGYLGPDDITDQAKIYTNKGDGNRYKWKLYIGNNQVTNLFPDELKVMNCMFYGDITGVNNRYPIYGGPHVPNTVTTNYNYFHNDNLPESHITEYNSALAALDKNLTRFEFYRSILNSNRKLAAWYITGNVANTNVVAKWVLDPEIAPYPILKPWGKYPSVINRASYAAGTQAELTAKKVTPSQDLSDGTNRYVGKVLGVLKVNLRRGTNGTGDNTTIYLPITDMDTNHFDYNYYKVQLPYYNDYFGGNYTTKAVTGWDIVSVVGGTTGTLSTSGNNAYNYADRKCTAKDANRTFAQGGFYYVPEGVSEITIRAHWANAVYLKDINSRYDNVYTGDGTYTAFTAPGTIPNYGVNNTTTYTSWATAANSFTQGNSVYDNVIVLISNHRATSSVNTATKPYSIMSIDLDHDNEPDYMLTQEFNDRQDIDAIRFDFLFQVGAGMAQKRNNSTNYNSIGIYHPKGHFEITETSCAQFTEFEYNQNRNTAAPLILMNSIVDQIVSAHNANVTTTNYVILGGHLWMKAYTPGCHTDEPTNTYTTQFAPVTVLGGDYESFYLTGMRPQTRTNDVTGRIYTNGGRMKEYASSYQEQLNGNVFAKFDHSVVWEFYGGGVSATTPVKGDINVEINHSMVSQYVGGPKFGYIQSSKKVETKATGTVFGYYYGASYGGTSLRKPKPNDATGATYDYNWVNDNFNSIRLSRSNNNELLTGYQIEFFSYAGGRTPERRLYQEWASLSLSTTLKTRSVLDSCYVKHDYFGGGRLGKVQTGNNDTLVSIINNSLIDGNAYGGGFSASIPTLEVMKAAVQADMPTYNGNTGIYSDIKYPETESYTWTNETLNNYVSQSRKLLQTTENLNDLGKVDGNTFIQVENTHVKGHVFGGGFGSEVTGNTEVVILGSSVIEKNVYGGGNAAEVGGDTRVVIGE